jgi:hypothetical protein
MSIAKLRAYYTLCTINGGGRRHMVVDLNRQQMEAVFTANEVNLYFDERSGVYLREHVIGGGQGRGKAKKNAWNFDRAPVIVYG